MKKKLFFLFALFSCFCLSVKGQTTMERILYNSFGGQFPVEKMSDYRMTEKDAVCLTTYYDMGEVGHISFQVVNEKNIENDSAKNFVRFRFPSLRNDKICIGTLSSEELDKCLKMFDYAKANLPKGTEETTVNLIFTNSYFTRIGYAQTKKGWRVIFSSNYIDPQNHCEIIEKDYDSLVALFASMKNKIIELQQK